MNSHNRSIDGCIDGRWPDGGEERGVRLISMRAVGVKITIL